MNRKITQKDWQSILRIMQKHNRKEGWVDLVEDDVLFFDEDPRIGGVSAAHVTYEQVEKYAKQPDA